MSLKVVAEELIVQTITAVDRIVPMVPYCLPTNMQNALDTAKFWAAIAGGALAVIALMFVGISIFFHNRRGDGTQIVAGLGYWILGVSIFAAAAVITSILIPGSGGCTPIG